MLVVNVHEAKTHLSKLLARIAQGESIVIAKAGKPIARLSPIVEPEAKKPQRIGALAGQLHIPDDFDTMFQQEIEDLFYNSQMFPEESAVGQDKTKP